MTESNRNILICILLASVVGFLLIKTLSRKSAIQQNEPIYLSPVIKQVKSLYLKSPGKQEASIEGLLHYKNKETRNVEWNPDGLPSKITIEREYYQLP